jgi:hydrogenase nickel incorporation protein HypB
MMASLSRVWFPVRVQARPRFWRKPLTILHQNHRVAALVGDLATDNDAARLARSHAPVKQITTGTLCHLEAAMVQNALDGWEVGKLDFLFVENVGNLVCPSSYDLGEDLRLVLLSVTEGEDKPLKYPTIFNSADVAVVTKMDLANAVEFDEAAARANIQAVRPGIQVFTVSSKNGAGLKSFSAFSLAGLREYVRRRQRDSGGTRQVRNKESKWAVFFHRRRRIFPWHASRHGPRPCNRRHNHCYAPTAA